MTVQRITDLIDEIVKRYGLKFFDVGNQIENGRIKFVVLTIKFKVKEEKNA